MCFQRYNSHHGKSVYTLAYRIEEDCQCTCHCVYNVNILVICCNQLYVIHKIVMTVYYYFEYLYGVQFINAIINMYLCINVYTGLRA